MDCLFVSVSLLDSNEEREEKEIKDTAYGIFHPLVIRGDMSALVGDEESFWCGNGWGGEVGLASTNTLYVFEL